MDYSERPPIVPESALQALSNLSSHVDDLNEIAGKTLINKRSLYEHLVRFVKPCKLPDDIGKFSAKIQYLIDWDGAGLGLFCNYDMVPLDEWRIENTLERLLKPLIYLSYILVRGAVSPPRRLNKGQMIAAIAKLADDVAALGEHIRPFIRLSKYQRMLHAVTRLRRAEAAWRESLGF